MTIISKFIYSIPQKYWLLLLIILALVLRLINLDQYGLWYDEAISYKAAQLDVISILTNQIQSHAPLYYLILHYWISIFPDSDYSARMLSVVWNVALIPVVYCLANELFKENKIALISAFLIVISPFHIAYSQELRMYTQLMFFTTSGILIYLYATKYNNFMLWIAFTAVFFFAIYTHYFSALVLIGIFLHEIILKNNIKSFYILFISCCILFILCIPWIYVVLSQPDLSEGSLRPLFEGRNIQKASFFIPLINLCLLTFGKIHNLLYFSIALYTVLLFFAIFILHIVRTRHDINKSAIFLFTIIVVTIIVPSLAYYVFFMFFPHRSIAAASPLVLILMAWGIANQNKILEYLLYITIILSITGLFYYHIDHSQKLYKKPYAIIAEFIETNYSYSDNILHTDDFSYVPMLRYLNFPNHARLAGSPRQLRSDSAYEPIGGHLWHLNDIRKQSGRLWLVVASVWARDWQMEQRNYLLQRFNLIDEYVIEGYRIYLLDLNGS